MSDKIEGYIEVGHNESGEIVVNIPPNKKRREQHGTNCAYRGDPDELCNCGVEYEHIVFSPNQARNLAHILEKSASEAEMEMRRKAEEGRRKAAEALPVDHNARTLTDGSPVSEDHREIEPSTGMQKGYVVLSAEERAKGFVRPVRRSYKHLKCGSVTSMGQSIAETYARCPTFYSGTFCSTCSSHFPVGENGQFVWLDDGSKVGT